MTELAEAITFDTCWTLTTVSTGIVDNSCMMSDLIYINWRKARDKLRCLFKAAEKKKKTMVKLSIDANPLNYGVVSTMKQHDKASYGAT